jgi:hypothetical protein
MTVNISQKRNIEHFTTWQLGTNFFTVIMLVSLCAYPVKDDLFPDSPLPR